MIKMKQDFKKLLVVFSSVLILITANFCYAAEEEVIKDALGQKLTVSLPVERVICSGPGALRLLTYLCAQDMAVAVDDIETRKNVFDARPYAIANPWFKKMPVFGNFRGFDNPELILGLEKLPQVIFKTYFTMGHDPAELQAKTQIPVIPLDYGNIGVYRKQLYNTLKIMGEITGKQERAKAVSEYFETLIKDLNKRTADIPESAWKTCFVGGIASSGPHGFKSTEPGYPPFMFVNAKNMAYDEKMMGAPSRQVTVAKEVLLEWDPDVLFLDLATLQLQGKASGYWELFNDPVIKSLTAVTNKKVYALLPYNWYTKNFGSILADAYYVGKVLYPERFKDIDPASKADEIYTFLLGKPVFKELNQLFNNMVFTNVMDRS